MFVFRNEGQETKLISVWIFNETFHNFGAVHGERIQIQWFRVLWQFTCYERTRGVVLNYFSIDRFLERVDREFVLFV